MNSGGNNPEQHTMMTAADLILAAQASKFIVRLEDRCIANGVLPPTDELKKTIMEEVIKNGWVRE
jgi:hypothetical protein